MAGDRTTRDLSDRHAQFIAGLFGAPVQRGSGNQSNRQTDNRMAVTRYTPIAFAFEGKSTQNQSMGLRLADWQKVREQAHGLRPALAYRFYEPNNLLIPVVDLITVDAHDFAEILDEANIRREMRDR
jgi:hypothetical protein